MSFKSLTSSAVCLVLLVAAAGARATNDVNWRVITPDESTPDVVVAGCDVRECGAKGDATTDDTAAFQVALNKMGQAGGGTVFVPAGSYVVRGNLVVPFNVTLRGQWSKPSGKLTGDTVLMAYAGRGNADGTPFITLRVSAAVKDLAIWYPEQDPANIVPYPFCLMQEKTGPTVIERITLVNPYQGISKSRETGGLPTVKSVYGSPLFLGIELPYASDIPRFENIHFSPQFWSRSGLPGAPAEDGPHVAWMRQHGTGFRTLRADWIYAAFADFSSHRCDNHYLEYLCGSPAGICVSVGGGSLGGQVRNCQFVTHFWVTSPFRENRPAHEELIGYKKDHVEGFLVGSCANELMFENFVFGCRVGLRFELGYLPQYSSFCAEGGSLCLRNLYLNVNRMGKPELVLSGGGIAKTLGCITGGLEVSGSQAVSQYDTLHGEPLPKDARQISTILGDRQTSFGLVTAKRFPAMLGSAAARATQPNVLFIIVDDLRPELACYGHPLVKSPNIDRLAGEGLLFRRAYCQTALCMPSRSSVLSGYRPETLRNGAGPLTGKAPAGTITLPQCFRNHGYATVSTGKVYHYNDDDPAGWGRRYTDTFSESAGYCSGYQLAENRQVLPNYFRPRSGKTADLPRPRMSECAEAADEAYPDGIIARHAIEELRNFKQSGQPFFLAAGFYRPHMPWAVPKKYWDMYDRAKLSLPGMALLNTGLNCNELLQ